nr:serine/threonine-protein kinase [Thioalkalivibrio sp. XN279]
MIGVYRLESLLGEGGMGQVWLAEQTRPIRRRVAVKMVKAGMDTRRVIARFEAERQALATLSHPAVAAVLDAGETALGRPYFVMEYVDGLPLDRYCDEHRLDTRARLALFLRVCEGVQHAHNKTIVHRDLKPSNILVTTQESGPQPKIIDFGIAKALSGAPEPGERLTEIGRPVGTPEYMSPEQLGQGDEVVDTRSDVYSLGVMLCELLTGCLPHARAQGDTAGPTGRTAPVFGPTQPSRLLARSGTLVAVAHARATSGEDLLRLVRGDLDWIILKAIDPDPERRYDSPRALAADLERFLTARPVQARPPTLGYLLSRFARRHRLAVSLSVALALSVIVGAGAALASWLRALEAEQVARQEAETAGQTVEFLTGLFSAADPALGGRATVNILELVEAGARRLESGEIRDPVVAAYLASTVGEVYSKLSVPERGFAWLLRAHEAQSRLLGREHPDTLKTARRIAFAYWGYGPVERGVAFQQRVVDAYRERYGVAAAATLDAELMLARIWFRLGEGARAEALATEVLARAREAGSAAVEQELAAGALLAAALRSQGRLAEAEQALREVIAGRREALGADHIDTAAAEQMLAAVLVALGNFEEAEALIDSLRGKVLTAFGPGHKAEFRLLSNEALLRRAQGRLPEAEALERRVLAGFRGMLEPGHPDIGLAARALAETLLAQGRHADAEALLLDALREERRANGGLGPNARPTIAMLERIHTEQGMPERTAVLLAALEAG